MKGCYQGYRGIPARPKTFLTCSLGLSLDLRDFFLGFPFSPLMGTSGLTLSRGPKRHVAQNSVEVPFAREIFSLGGSALLRGLWGVLVGVCAPPLDVLGYLQQGC